VRIAVATWTGSATPSSGRHMRPARHNFQNAISSDRERAHDLDRRAIVKGSKQDQDMLRFRMISQWTCHRPKIACKRRSAGSVHLALGRQPNWTTGPPPRSEYSSGMCDPWHARQWETSQIGRWARLHDVGSQKQRWRAHCCHVLPRVSEQPASDEAIPEKGEGFRLHQPVEL